MFVFSHSVIYVANHCLVYTKKGTERCRMKQRFNSHVYRLSYPAQNRRSTVFFLYFAEIQREFSSLEMGFSSGLLKHELPFHGFHAMGIYLFVTSHALLFKNSSAV